MKGMNENHTLVLECHALIGGAKYLASFKILIFHESIALNQNDPVYR